MGCEPRGIREMTTASTTTGERPRHVGAEASGVGVNQAAVRSNKHERISLKKLHSLRNQLFCGFKSFASSTSEQAQPETRARTSTTEPAPMESPSTGRSNKLNSNNLQLEDEAKRKQENEQSFMMMVGDQRSAASSCAGGKSSSWTSLTNQQSYNQVIKTSDQESDQLANSNEEDSSLRTPATRASKQASFRRLTGRSVRKQASDEQPEMMIKLIKQLDRLAKSLGEMEGNESARQLAESSESDIFYLEKSWTDFVRLNPSEECEVDSDSDSRPSSRSSLKIQQDAIWELLTSEVFYLKRLRVILSAFLQTLTRLQHNSLLLNIDPARLTSNIEEVYLANHVLWTDNLLPMLLRSRLSGCPLDPCMMRDVFIKIRSLFGSYYRYCLEHTACLDYLRDKNKHDQYFKVYLAWCESQKDCERLRLMDLLAKPMQRLTKYPLLLKAIYRRTHDRKQIDDLSHMIIGMEKFVLTVDLGLRDRDEHEQLRSTADRIESLDIGSGDNYNCDEVNRIIMQYCRAYHLCKPLFGCGYGCNRRLMFDSSRHEHNLGQFKFKDSQLNGKVDIVLLLFTDQLLICKQVSNRWYANSSSQNNAQERSPVHSIKSSIYNKSFSSRQRGSTKKSSSQVGWIKSRSGSGNHLVDSLILANDCKQSDKQNKFGRLLSAHNSGGSEQQPISFHLSTSSLVGNAAREHFVLSKSADGSRSGESFIQSPGKSLTSSRLRAIRSPYPIDRLAMHELADGHRIFCCQLNDSNTIATSFILHMGSAASSESPRGSIRGDQQQHNSLRQTSATIDSSLDTTMHHLSPISGHSKRSKQNQISPARKLINLIEQTQLRYRVAANFHGIPPVPIHIEAIKQEPISDALSMRREKLDSSATRTTSSISRSSELMEFSGFCSGERQPSAKADSSLDAAFQDNDMSKAILEQEQSMLLKHGKYEQLQTSKLDCSRHLSCNLVSTTTGSVVSPLLSTSIDDTKMVHVPAATSQNSVFEPDCNLDRGTKTDPGSADVLVLGDRLRGAKERETSENLSVESGSHPKTRATSIQASLPVCCQQDFDRRRGHSWSCSNGTRRPLASISGSEIESTASDISPRAHRCSYLEQDSSAGARRQNSMQHCSHRRQPSHLRRQNDIVSFSHDQQENSSASQACIDPSASVDGDQFNSSASNTVDSLSLGLSHINEPISVSNLSHHRRYLSLARRMMHEQNSSSQATTMDQTSITLNDNQMESLDSAEAKAHSRAVSIELGNLKARLSFCAHGESTDKGQQSIDTQAKQTTKQPEDDQVLVIVERDLNLPEKADSPFEGCQIYLEIPSENQQVDGEISCHHNLSAEASRKDATSTCGRTEEFSSGQNDGCCWNHPPDNQTIKSLTTINQVSVPILNITSVDSHLPRHDLDCHSRRVVRGLPVDMETKLFPGKVPGRAKYLEANQGDDSQPLNQRNTQATHLNEISQITNASPCEGGCVLRTANCNQRFSVDSSDAARNHKRPRDHSIRRCPSKARGNGYFDDQWTGINYKGSLLELKCIHKLIRHQDNGHDAACGKVYLGFYEKLDLHLKQTSDKVNSRRLSAMNPEGDDCSRIERGGTMKQPNEIVPGRHSPARSDSSTSKKVRTLRMFTNDLIGSLVRATSSCSVHSKN